MYEGYVFLCNKSTLQNCISSKRYVCSDKQYQPPEPISEGSVIFLYNVDDKTLLGPFTALAEGASQLDAGTWTMNVNEHVPSEDIMVSWEDLHIIQNADVELPFLSGLRTCKLSSVQTQNILDSLKKGELYLKAKGSPD